MPFQTNCCAVAENGNILWNNIGYDSNQMGDNYFVLTDSAFQILGTAVEKQFKSGYASGDSRNVYTFQGKTYAYSPFDLSVWEIGDSIMDKSIQLSWTIILLPYSFLMEKAMAGKILILRFLKSLIMSLIIQSGSLLIIAVCYILSIMKDLPLL